MAGGGKTRFGRGANLVVRFACELAAIAAVAWWGFGVSWVLGVAALGSGALNYAWEG